MQSTMLNKLLDCKPCSRYMVVQCKKNTKIRKILRAADPGYRNHINVGIQTVSTIMVHF